MSRLRFALLDASDTESTRRNFRRELDADLAEFDVTAGDLPPHFAWDGVVVTGSRVSVYWDDEHEWIRPLVDWVGEAASRDVPLLGVCYGHQVLAEALGGTVEHMGEYELGYREVTHHGDDIFAGVDDSFTVFVSHQDRVTDLPPGADLIAENEYGVHGFRHGDAVGVQFHPEYDLSTAEEIARGKDVPAEQERRVMAGINPENFAAACETKRLFDNFVDRARRRRRGEAAD
jgi:GMP synthase (glutamine-hydrolysing)